MRVQFLGVDQLEAGRDVQRGVASHTVLSHGLLTSWPAVSHIVSLTRVSFTVITFAVKSTPAQHILAESRGQLNLMWMLELMDL